MARARRAEWPACPEGHPFPQNLYVEADGYGRCIQCKRDQAREWRQQNRPPRGHDPVAVERAVAGEVPERLVHTERTAAIQILTARNASARQIAEQLGCSPRTVHRARSRTAAVA